MITACNENISINSQLARWLFEKSQHPSITSKIEYHLGGRVALLGASLLSLVEAVGRAVLGAIVWIGYLVSLGDWEKAKNFAIKQLQEGSFAGFACLQCLCSLISPKELEQRLYPTQKVEPSLEPQEQLILKPQTPDGRNKWTVQNPEKVEQKLQKQLQRAQSQKDREKNKNFLYQCVPGDLFTHEVNKGAASAQTEIISGYEVGICQYIGRRSSMEDTHLATSFNLTIEDTVYPVQLFGIFDGHGGNAASIYVKEHLSDKLQETLHEFCSKELTKQAIWNALKITFVKLHQEFLTAEQSDSSGTTAIVTMILDGQLWIANVGDSRAILDNGSQLSEDADLTEAYYRKGVTNRNGRVEEIGYGNQSAPRILDNKDNSLGVARAIGDRDFQGINPRPKITVYPLSKDPQLLLLGCDGIFEVASTRQIATCAQENKSLSAENLAKNIVYSSYKSGSGDNLSFLVVKLGPQKKEG